MDMPRIWKHECTKPIVYDYDFKLLSDEEKERAKEAISKGGKLKVCNYCDAVWVETRDYSNSRPLVQMVVVRVRDIGAKI